MNPASWIDRRKRLTESAGNPAEEWMYRKLTETGLKWTRQAKWGKRTFDFWCAAKGIAVEVDSPVDKLKDLENYNRAAIVVLRVRGFNEPDAAAALARISEESTWNDRRRPFGMKPMTESWLTAAAPPPPQSMIHETIRFRPEVHKAAMAIADADETTLDSVVNEAVRQFCHFSREK